MEKRLPELKGKAVSVTALLLVCLVVGFVGGWLGAISRSHQALLDTSTNQQIISGESRLISQIAEEVGQSVVSINVSSPNEYTDFFGRSSVYESRSAGTGIILSEDGVIMTNRHVVPDDDSDISIVLSDGTELTDVDVIGRTSEADSLDVAFLRVRDTNGKDLKPAKIGDSGAVIVGEKVVAIGNALGQFQNTVTQGIISGYGRSVLAEDDSGNDELQNLFQTDAAINQGNSGGPLVNMQGQVIGINTAVAGGAENIGFAIPINDTKGLIDTVLETGRFERPYLGVRYVSLNEGLSEELNTELKQGAYIVESTEGEPSILPDSPAEAADLHEKDIITHINGEAVDERHSLGSLIGKYQVGEEVRLTIQRDGQELHVTAMLAAFED